MLNEIEEKSAERFVAEYIADRGFSGYPNNLTSIFDSAFAESLTEEAREDRIKELREEFTGRIAEGLNSDIKDPTNTEVEAVINVLENVSRQSISGEKDEFTDNLTEALKQDFPKDLLGKIIDTMLLKIEEKEAKLENLPEEFRDNAIAKIYSEEITDAKEALGRIDLADVDGNGTISIGEFAKSVALPVTENDKGH